MSNLVVAEKAHATLGASSASRWMACPGSVRLARGIPNRETDHSREGTAAHALAETCLRKGVEADTFVGMTLEGVEVTDEMAEHVTTFVRYCRSLMSAVASGSLHVVDLKYGQGVVVEVIGNKQLRYYGLGAALSLHELKPIAGKPYAVEQKFSLAALNPPAPMFGTADFVAWSHEGDRVERVHITIVQPRAAHPDGVIRSEVLPLDELVAFSSELLDAARATTDPNAPLAAGDHCRWCPAIGVCPEQRRQAQALAQVDFDVMPLDLPPAPESLPVVVLAEMLQKVDVLEAWIKGMRAHAQGMLERGEDVPGFKLVARRATRKWTSEEQTRRWLEGKGYASEEIEERKLKSPAQLEKVLGPDKKSLPAEFVTKQSSGYTMALESDVRPAVSVTAGSEFDALPASTE